LWFTESGGEPEQGLLLIGQAGPAASKEKVAGRIAAMAGEVASKGESNKATFTSFRFRRNPCYTWVVVPARDTSTLQIDIQWKQDAAVDYSEMSRVLELPFTVTTAELLHAEHSAHGDVTDLLRYSGEDYAELLPNEWIDLEFTAPPLQEGMQRSFVFVSRGRYDAIEQKQAVKAGTTETQASTHNAPVSFRLEQNFPNPFNPMTVIRFSLPDQMQVKIVLYDVLGRLVRTLVDKELPAGDREVMWDGKSDGGVNAPSGVYLCRITAGRETAVRRMLLVK